MRSWCLALALVTGCYDPTPQAGAPCGADGACPRGLRCRADRCVDASTPPDDALAIDARLVDAAPPPDAFDPDVGCADGTREAFVSAAAFPNIAGCAATWNGPLSMRAPSTSQPCGNAQPCAAPADACASGWHVCATSGDPMELVSRTSEADCISAGNSADTTARFVTAVSHCTTYQTPVCEYAVPRGCEPNMSCAEPICCGQGCRYDAGCPTGAYAMTGVAGTLENGCGTMLAATISGVLCCR